MTISIHAARHQAVIYGMVEKMVSSNSQIQEGHALSIAIGLMMLELLLAGGASAATITVDDSGGEMFTKIQDAINNATAGDTILVNDGMYIENVNVNKRLTIISKNGAASTIVKALNPTNNVFEVTTDFVKISGFTAKGATGDKKSAIYLNGADNLTISNSQLISNYCGIALDQSNYNKIINNNASSNSYCGIGLYKSNNNFVVNNLASNNKRGIALVTDSGSCSVEHSIYNSKVPEPEEKLNLLRQFRDNDLKYEYVRLYYQYSPDIKEILIEKPSLSIEFSGIILKYLPALNIIRGNKLQKEFQIDAKDVGQVVYFVGKLENEVLEKKQKIGEERAHELLGLLEEFKEEFNKSEGRTFNQAFNTSIYISKIGSKSEITSTTNINIIYNNNILNNTEFNAYDDTNNQWDGGYPSGGNYYSNYTGVDLKSGQGQNLSGADGIGDTPYNISGSGGSKDRYPLMNPIVPSVLEVPVILVHGLMNYPKDDDWAKTMKKRFIDQGFNVSIFNYEGVNQEIQESAIQLMLKIKEVKEKYNTDKVDIVGHSEGGLVARYYINSYFYNNDVRKLVMIGSPNHGTDIKNWKEIGNIGGPLGDIVGELIYYWNGGVAGPQMESHSYFLKKLNGNDNCADLQHGSDKDYFNPNVTYYTIASHTPWYLYLPTFSHMHVFDKSFITTTWDGDVLTADSSLMLNTGVYDKDIIPNVFHGQDQVNSKDIIDKAIYFIREKTPSSGADVASNIEQTPDYVAAQWSSPIQGIIKPNEVKMPIVYIDNTTKKAYFNLFWEGSDLDLVLYTPSGAKINSSVASNNSNINYTSGAIFESYEVRFPEQGNWTMEITAVNVTSTGENYSAITFMETNLFVAAGTNKDSYVPNEQITVAAYVQNNGNPLSNANVTATISRPDGINSTIELYDDGLHNDNKTDDGIYANVYTNTNVSGEYYITTSANGIIGNESFERIAFKNVWVEQYPDLTITSSDVNFSNDAPIAGENIKINATIYNIGDTDANNASIFFYDGNLAGGVLIAEKIINVTVGQTAIESISWNTTAGQHEIYVLISPFNEFLEKNYSNNKASKIIKVIPSVAKLKGDLNDNGIPADAGDLVLMKRASIGEILADSRYDLNDNGQNADAGDLVLMKRASIGEINL